ncbi:hypothetical protein KEM55_004373 [Ascosphaera atra]|nr:hypothetical protein KEM55_004373 [Ascosphaera atra]
MGTNTGSRRSSFETISGATVTQVPIAGSRSAEQSKPGTEQSPGLSYIAHQQKALPPSIHIRLLLENSIDELEIPLTGAWEKEIVLTTWGGDYDVPRKVFAQGSVDVNIDTNRYALLAQAGGFRPHTSCDNCVKASRKTKLLECRVNPVWPPKNSCVACLQEGRGCTFQSGMPLMEMALERQTNSYGAASSTAKGRVLDEVTRALQVVDERMLMRAKRRDNISSGW